MDVSAMKERSESILGLCWQGQDPKREPSTRRCSRNTKRNRSGGRQQSHTQLRLRARTSPVAIDAVPGLYLVAILSM